MERNYLLLLRFTVLNIAALALLWVAWLQGWLHKIWALDITHLSSVIAAVFVLGWAICAHKILRCSQELNAATAPGRAGHSRIAWYKNLLNEASAESRMVMAECLRARLYSRISVVRTIANNLVILGLIGTVIGFIIALSGVEPESVADLSTVAPMVSTLIQGMSVALFTTLVGAIAHVWLTLCYQVLATGTVNLANAIIERAEVADFPNTIELP